MDFKKVDFADPWTYSFGALMTIATLMDTKLDKALKPFDLTSKQWFLLMILRNLFETPPTLKQVAAALGSSYQNVKQVALKLEAKGFLVLERDQNDLRAFKIILTDKARTLNDELAPSATLFIKKLYQHIPAADMHMFQKTLNQIMLNVSEID